ncbi:DUF2059 domain-containing protein [Pseudomonas luteola]
MEPVMTDIYKKSFNQREMKFYQSEEGRSVVTKMPIAMQNSMQAIQASTMNIAPELNKIIADGKQQLIALDKAQPPAKEAPLSGPLLPGARISYSPRSNRALLEELHSRIGFDTVLRQACCQGADM